MLTDRKYFSFNNVQKNSIRRGIRDAVPIILGYLPIGMAFGMLAVKKGLTAVQTAAMSIFVFAGSAQLVSIEMIDAGAAAAAVVAMTFLVNLRHLLLSASLSLHLRNLPGYYYAVLGFFITDESFAVASANLDESQDKKLYFLFLGVTAYLGWVSSSALGAFLSDYLSIEGGGLLDYVLPAMFIVLLVLQISSRKEIVVAAAAAFLSLLFALTLDGSWNIILAAALAAALGVFLDAD